MRTLLAKIDKHCIQAETRVGSALVACVWEAAVILSQKSDKSDKIKAEDGKYAGPCDPSPHSMQSPIGCVGHDTICERELQVYGEAWGQAELRVHIHCAA